MKDHKGYVSYCETPTGTMTMWSDGEALTALSFGRMEPEGEDTTEIADDLPVFQETRKWLDIYFSGQIPDFTPKIKLTGTDFRMMVWDILKSIPYGATTTYGEIGAEIARRQGREKMSAQAVGGAVGSNPVAIIIPCHRVIGKDGSLTGFAAGLETKIKLLETEGIWPAKAKINTGQ